MDSADNIRSQALGLSAAQRASLVHDLLVSLDEAGPDADADVAWAEELEARSAAYVAGEAQASDWQESVARLRASLKQN